MRCQSAFTCWEGRNGAFNSPNGIVAVSLYSACEQVPNIIVFLDDSGKIIARLFAPTIVLGFIGVEKFLIEVEEEERDGASRATPSRLLASNS